MLTTARGTALFLQSRLGDRVDDDQQRFGPAIQTPRQAAALAEDQAH